MHFTELHVTGMQMGNSSHLDAQSHWFNCSFVYTNLHGSYVVFQLCTVPDSAFLALSHAYMLKNECSTGWGHRR